MDVHSCDGSDPENDNYDSDDSLDINWNPHGPPNDRMSFLASEDEEMDNPDDDDVERQEKLIEKRILMVSKKIDEENWVPGRERKRKAVGEGKGVDSVLFPSLFLIYVHRPSEDVPDWS